MKCDISIDKELLLNAKNKLTMSLDDFVEYSLSMYLQHDDKYAKLFYEGAEHYSELKKIQDKIHALDNKKEDDNDESLEKAMFMIQRIHDEMKYIGKNQIRDAAINYDLSPNDLVSYVESLDGFEVRKFGALPK